MYDETIYTLDNVYIEGYFACEYYYIDIIDLLRKRLKFSVEENSRNSLTAQKMQNEIAVSLHIRRGDYLNKENRDIFGGICTNKYYESAIKYVESKFHDIHFYVFSDDIAYVQKLYGEKENYTIVDWNTAENSWLDMYLMSNCIGNICANSTFSFWGARLNPNSQKIMIRPLKQRNNMDYFPEVLHPLWKDWILIDEKGKIV